METLIAMFIITLLGIVVVNFQLNIFSLNKISNNNLVAQEDLRRVLKTASAEIRSMSQPVSGVHVIETAGTSSLSFYTNIDSDSAIEKVRYFLSGTTLKKGVINPTGTPATTYSAGNEILTTIANNLMMGTTTIFEYYDTNYDGTTAPLSQPVNILNIRLVKINIIIDDNPLKSPAPLYMTTQVSIRNLKDNL